MEFVGKTLKKRFKGFTGTIQSYDASSGSFRIVYPDGGFEDLDSSQVASALSLPQPDPAAPDPVLDPAPQLGPKPSKRRRVEPEKPQGRGDQGNSTQVFRPNGNVDLNDGPAGDFRGCGSLNVDLNETLDKASGVVEERDYGGFREGFDLNASGFDFNLNEEFDLNQENGGGVPSRNFSSEENLERKKRECIDLNLDVSGDLDEGVKEVVETQKRECVFDLNLGVDDDGEIKHDKIVSCDGGEQVNERAQLPFDLVRESTSQDMKEGGGVGDEGGMLPNGTLGEVSVSGLLEGVRKEVIVSSEGLGPPISAALLDAKPAKEDCAETIHGNAGHARSAVQETTSSVRRRGRRRKAADNLNSAAVETKATAGVTGIEKECTVVIDANQGDATTTYQQGVGSRRRGRRRKVADNSNSSPRATLFADANVAKEDCTLQMDGNEGELDSSYQQVSGSRRRGRRRKLITNLGSTSELPVFMEPNGAKEDSTMLMDGIQVDVEASCKELSGSRRKRRKTLDNLNITPETTALRRSSRRGTTKNSTTTSSMVYDLLSPELSELTEENTVKSRPEWPEEHAIIPLKVQLPSSSNNLDLGGIPILDIFSIYACLRSFSTLLFLSPFELEDFVTAVKCNSPNSLFDCIHVSILRTLKTHLEYLANEGSESASDCLRSLNWGLLDMITWPVFMVEYLLIHGSELRSGFDLSRLKLFKSDYYKQPVSVKLELLRCLCDDMIEVEAIRSELSRRSSGTEFDTDFDRNVNLGAHKKRRAMADVSGGSCLTEEAVDGSSDWNSDECCLCKMDGNLICCDGCPAAYHSKCVGVANDLLPEGDWYCPECALDRHKPYLKTRKSLRGAEPLGVDPHGRLYFSSCGYLLVSDSCDPESSFSYFHSNNIKTVIEVLKSSGRSYSSILEAVQKHWDMPFKSYRGSSNLVGLNHTMTIDSCIPQEALAFPKICAAKDNTADGRKPEEVSVTGSSGHLYVEVSKSVSQTCMCSEGSAETIQMNSGNQNLLTDGLDCCNKSAELSNVGENSLSSNGLDIKKGKNIVSVASGCVPSAVNTANGDMLQLQPERYVNYYSFGHTSSSIAEVLLCKSSDKTMEDSLKTEEEMVSAQMKVISQKATKFHWPNIPRLGADVQKEKCGWCFSCRGPADDSDCLLNMCLGPVQEGTLSEVVGLQSKRSRKGYLTDVICHILLIEDRLQGLLLGPWLNPHYTKIWRKNVLKASNVVSVKRSLLMLESNVNRLALLPDWWKHVDSAVTVGSASHIVTTSVRGSSKNGVGRKRVRSSELELNPSANCVSGLTMYWRRGGELSRQIFNWKALPTSLVSKAARQGGCVKIPDILYPENSDFAKRSKFVAWRAAVESSKTAEQLALQVRELDLNIKWDEIENTHLLPMVDKELRKSIRLFKKAIIRRKSVEGEHVKYLLDFGKRRSIPEVVLKNGSVVEESSSERKKYWLNEAHVPLHLLKSFEEKRIARKCSLDKLTSEAAALVRKPLKRKGFSYLFAKAERSEYHKCGHCNKDVPIRDAVCCQYCKGFFHKRHVRKSAGSIVAESVYTCHRCQDGKSVNIDKKKGKSNTKKGKTNIKCLKKSKRTPVGSNAIQLKNGKKSFRNSRPLRSQKNKVVVVPLRRSPRKAKQISLQKKKVRGRKRGRPAKSKKGTCKKTKKDTSLRKKRSQTYHSYWLNGLLFSRKPDDERVMQFRRKRYLAPFQSVIDQPKCHLCCEAGYSSLANYISCEMCGEWFHGDAFGLDADNISKLIGFRCHVCLKKISPVCPLAPALGSDEALMAKVQNVQEIDCPSERVVEDELHPSDNHHGSHAVDESFHREGQLGTALVSNMSFTSESKLESENMLTLHSSREETDTVQASIV
ncbi:hypothetical protein Tsubulata_000757 [Turnera subulata]|uniref:PHD-type domain-containing protein n=1 Tax=Turnera subulata TaxID=218843 RepID=A0A9Q0GBH7_9ROSI|nr:hypothetical protein Tsubulata_000757 [Turnera subulata]